MCAMQHNQTHNLNVSTLFLLKLRYAVPYPSDSITLSLLYLHCHQSMSRKFLQFWQWMKKHLGSQEFKINTTVCTVCKLDYDFLDNSACDIISTSVSNKLHRKTVYKSFNYTVPTALKNSMNTS